MPTFSGSWERDALVRNPSGQFYWTVGQLAAHYGMLPAGISMYRTQRSRRRITAEADKTRTAQTNRARHPQTGPELEGHDPARKA